MPPCDRGRRRCRDFFHVTQLPPWSGWGWAPPAAHAGLVQAPGLPLCPAGQGCLAPAPDPLTSAPASLTGTQFAESREWDLRGSPVEGGRQSCRRPHVSRMLATGQGQARGRLAALVPGVQDGHRACFNSRASPKHAPGTGRSLSRSHPGGGSLELSSAAQTEGLDLARPQELLGDGGHGGRVVGKQVPARVWSPSTTPAPLPAASCCLLGGEGWNSGAVFGHVR